MTTPAFPLKATAPPKPNPQAVPLPDDAIVGAPMPADAVPVTSTGVSGEWTQAPWYDQPLPVPKIVASAYQKVKDFAEKPLANAMASPEIALPIASAKFASAYMKMHGHAEFAKPLDAYAGIMEGGADFATAMTSPKNLIMMFSFGKLKTLGAAGAALDRLISAGFSAQMLHQAYVQMPDVKKAIDSGNWEDAARAITSEAGNVLLGATAAHGAVEGTELAKNFKEGVKEEYNKRINATAPIGAEAQAGRIPIKTGEQGGHAGGGVASEEELNRPGRFISVNPKNGAVTDQGKVPDFREGVTGYQVHPSGKIELKAGTENPVTQRAAQNYHKEVYGNRVIPGNINIKSASGREIPMPKERTTGVHDTAIKQGGAIPAGVFPKAGKMENDLVMFHDPKTGSTLALPADKVTPENVFQHMEESRAKFEAGKNKLSKVPGAVEIATPKNVKAESIAKGADDFNTLHGRAPVEHTNEPVDVELGKKTADEYEKMQHNPHDPAVVSSYDALKRGIENQWDYATNEMGFKFEPSKEDPYENSRQMQEDVQNNKHLYFYSTENLPSDHPMAEVDPKTGLTYNQMFRAVHDLFGHAANGNQFGPRGERNAYLEHAQMFSPEAIPALTSETHGQNSWNNFGSHLRTESGEIPKKGEEGYIAPKDRPFAEQKAGILPSKVQTHPIWIKRTLSAMDESPAGALNPRTGTADTQGVGVEVYPEARAGRERLDHKPTAKDLTDFYADHRTLFEKHPELRIGWDKTNDGWELNIGASGTREGAVTVGNKLDQRAAWDIKKGEEVPLTGKGEKTNFEDYPLEQRLHELKGGAEELPIPSIHQDLFDKGWTWQSVRNHEMGGHALIGALNGFKVTDTLSHLDESNQRGALATQRLDLSNIGKPVPGDPTKFDLTAESIRKNISALLDTFLAGGVAQEVLDGIPVDKNLGMFGDLDLVDSVLHTVGLWGPERIAAMEASKARIRNVLTNPEVQNIIRKYTAHREEGVGSIC